MNKAEEKKHSTPRLRLEKIRTGFDNCSIKDTLFFILLYYSF